MQKITYFIPTGAGTGHGKRQIRVSDYSISETTNPNQADLVITNKLINLEPYIKKYGSDKSYLIYTMEPWRDMSIVDERLIDNCKVHVMNVYNKNVFLSNYHFVNDRWLLAGPKKLDFLYRA